MPNKNYRAGYRIENKTQRRLKTLHNEITYRSAGSHSPIDVTGFHQGMRQIFVGQCKTHEGIIDEKNTEILRELYGDWTVLPFNVWGQAKGEPDNLHFERLFEV